MRTSSSSSSVRSQQTPNQSRQNQTTPKARQASNLSLALGRHPTQSLAGSSSPAPAPSASGSSSSLGLGGKLMGLLDRQKYSIFQIELTIHDLANVPQLEGEFAVRWRFRGKRPKARDAVHRLHGHGHGHLHGFSTPGAGPSVAASIAPSPKPSLPNLKLTQPYAGSLHPSSSSISLRSSSTGGSSSTRSMKNGGLPMPMSGQAMKGKSMSTPPLPLPMTSLGKHGGRVDKKGSDPTPLRQSVGVDSDVDLETETVDSPTPFDPDSASYAGQHDLYTAGAGATSLAPYKQPSRSSTLPPTHPLATNSTSASSSIRSLQPSATLPATGPPSASSSTSHLSVPPSGSGSQTPMERSGSQLTTSAQSIHSGGSASSQVDQASLGVRHGDRPPGPRRAKSISGASFAPGSGSGSRASRDKEKSTQLSGRKGVTPGRPLKSHTCTWDHDLQLALRIPISKERNYTMPNGTGSSKLRAPLLGEGSQSSSGLQLVIEQLPTPSATANPKPTQLGSPSEIHDPNGEPSLSPTSTSTPITTSGKGERTVFGKVDIDLAAFAGRGKTTRKFLLNGSRTNATVRLTVDMSWIGGEGNWIAPPLQEGHHVTSGLRDVVGGRDANQDLERDLALVKTPSASSTDSSASHTHSAKSHNGNGNENPSASNLNLARAPSATLTQPRPQYKTYDHHLLSPDDAKFRSKDGMGSMDLGAQSPVSSASTSTQKQSSNTNNATTTPTTGSTSTAIATATGSSSASGSPSRSMFRFNHRHHHHHHRHLHDNRTKINGITELSPESVIEHIFNPYESHEDSPFTYMADPTTSTRARGFVLESPPALRDDEEHHENAPPMTEGEGGRNRLGGWRKKYRDKDKEKEKKDGGAGAGMSRTASGLGSIGASASVAASGSVGGMIHSHSFASQASQVSSSHSHSHSTSTSVSGGRGGSRERAGTGGTGSSIATGIHA